MMGALHDTEMRSQVRLKASNSTRRTISAVTGGLTQQLKEGVHFSSEQRVCSQRMSLTSGNFAAECRMVRNSTAPRSLGHSGGGGRSPLRHPPSHQPPTPSLLPTPAMNPPSSPSPISPSPSPHHPSPLSVSPARSTIFTFPTVLPPSAFTASCSTACEREDWSFTPVPARCLLPQHSAKRREKWASLERSSWRERERVGGGGRTDQRCGGGCRG